MSYSQGYLTVGSFDGAPIRIHWSTPLTAFVLGAGHWAPVFWMAYALVILTHEIGHALMVRRVGGTIESIEVTGWGGHCDASGSLTEFEEALVAGGGGAAQAVLFAVVGLLYLAFGYPQNELILELVAALLGLNLFLLLINLLPIPPLDGARAWPLALYGIALLREMRSRSERVILLVIWSSLNQTSAHTFLSAGSIKENVHALQNIVRYQHSCGESLLRERRFRGVTTRLG
jgi:Zn-dependent protease